MVQELHVVDGHYAGGGFDWVTPSGIFCGVGAVLGYALLGAAWLVLKTDGELRDWAYQRLPRLLGGVVVVLVIVFVLALAKHLDVFDRWSSYPVLLLPLADTVIDAMTLIIAAVGRTKIVTAKIEVLGLNSTSSSQ